MLRPKTRICPVADAALVPPHESLTVVGSSPAWQHPKTMVPFGCTSEGASCEHKAHTECYRLLLGVIDAARADPHRAAAFEAAHPTERYTRQQARVYMCSKFLHRACMHALD